MVNLELTLSAGRYAITEPLLDGSVRPQGVQFRSLSMPSPERHWRMLRHQEFDICELSLAGYVKALAADPETWAAIPVFPHRRYRHGYLFVASGSAVRTPADLAGGTVGLRTWATTAGVWMRGILQDDYEVDLRRVRWVTEHPEHVEGSRPGGFRIEQAGDRSLVRRLVDGEIQALIYPERLATPDVQPLFADVLAEEVSYARRTGLFPIMHLVAVRPRLLQEHPWLANELVSAFDRAKAVAYGKVSNPRWLPLAWGENALDTQREVLGRDPWVSGVEPNRPELETALRYCYEQGLVGRRLEPAELFWPSTVDRPPTYSTPN